MSENKDQVIRMRLTDDYKRQIQALADREGITLTELLSSAVDDYMKREGGLDSGFWIQKKFKQQIDYSIDQADTNVLAMIDCIARRLTDREYHELCHQLHGTKSEFDGPDDGECHIEPLSQVRKRAYTVKSALYRGIFWQTINEVQKITDRLYLSISENEDSVAFFEPNTSEDYKKFEIFVHSLREKGSKGTDNVSDLEGYDLDWLLNFARVHDLQDLLLLICIWRHWSLPERLPSD